MQKSIATQRSNGQSDEKLKHLRAKTIMNKYENVQDMKKSIAAQRTNGQSDEKLQRLGAKAIITKNIKKEKIRPDTRHKMRLVC